MGTLRRRHDQRRRCERSCRRARRWGSASPGLARRLADRVFRDQRTIRAAVTYRVHVVNVDGTNDVELPMPPGATSRTPRRGRTTGRGWPSPAAMPQHNEDMVLAVVPADGSTTGVETEHRHHRMLRHELRVVARRLDDPGDAGGTATRAASPCSSCCGTRRPEPRPRPVGCDDQPGLAANRSLNGRPRTEVRPARRRNGGGPRHELQQVPASNRPARLGHRQ